MHPRCFCTVSQKVFAECDDDAGLPRDDSLEVDLEIPEIDLKIPEEELNISGLDIWSWSNIILYTDKSKLYKINVILKFIGYLFLFLYHSVEVLS